MNKKKAKKWRVRVCADYGEWQYYCVEVEAESEEDAKQKVLNYGGRLVADIELPEGGGIEKGREITRVMSQPDTRIEEWIEANRASLILEQVDEYGYPIVLDRYMLDRLHERHSLAVKRGAFDKDEHIEVTSHKYYGSFQISLAEIQKLDLAVNWEELDKLYRSLRRYENKQKRARGQDPNGKDIVF